MKPSRVSHKMQEGFTLLLALGVFLAVLYFKKSRQEEERPSEVDKLRNLASPSFKGKQEEEPEEERLRSRSLLMGESGVGVELMGVMVGVCLAFAGFLLSRPQTPTVFLPILWNLLAFFGFFFSTLMYANVSSSVSRYKDYSGSPCVLGLADIVSEFLGVFPFLAALPLAVWELSANPIATVATVTLDVFFLGLYHWSEFDIITLYVSGKPKRLLVLCVLAGLTVTSVLLTVTGHLEGATLTTNLLLFALIIITVVLSIKWRHRESQHVQRRWIGSESS